MSPLRHEVHWWGEANFGHKYGNSSDGGVELYFQQYTPNRCDVEFVSPSVRSLVLKFITNKDYITARNLTKHL